MVKDSGFIYRRTWEIQIVVLFGMLVAYVFGITFLNTLVSGYSSGNIPKIGAIVPDEKIKQFNPNIVHRLWLIIDVVFIFYIFTFAISFVEYLVCYSTCSWYFTRKKEPAFLKPWLIMSDALLYHLGTVAKLTFMRYFLQIPKTIIERIRKLLRIQN